MKTRLLLFVLACLAVSSAPRAEILRMMTWNSLNFRGSADSDRIDDFRRVIGYVQPDVVAMQEIISEAAVDYLLSFAYLPNQTDWAAAQFVDGEDTDNILFYRTSKVNLVGQYVIPTDLRDINEYVLQSLAPDTSLRFHVYSAHLKAGNGSTDSVRRATECTALRQHTDQLAPGTLFVMVGDFNLYTSSERSYQILLSPADTDGQLSDPIDEPGNWTLNPAFAAIHTQSPRYSSFGGGAGGGMDDRFDFILASNGLMDTSGTYILPETYHPIGNDGQHFNESVNDGTNFAVPDSVADGLYYASDHLPVAVDILLRNQSMAADPPPVVQNYSLFNCYPNPFNSTLTIDVFAVSPGSTLSIYDLNGRQIREQTLAQGRQNLSIDFSGQTTGTYFVRLQSARTTQSQRIILIR